MEALAISTRAEAQQQLDAINQQLAVACGNEVLLERSWMRLGRMLASFKATEAWRKLGYQTFDVFMEELRSKYNRSRSQLWTYMNAYEALAKHYDAATIECLNIGKALEIRRAIIATGAALPDKIMEAAKLTTTKLKELRALIGQTLNVPDAGEKGTWFDFGGTYFTQEEKEEFKVAVDVAVLQLGLKKNIPEHIQRKEIFLAWAREFFQTWAHEVYGPQDPPAEMPGPAEPM